MLDRRKALAACVCFLATPAYATEASEIVAEVMQEPAVDILANPALVWKVGDAQGKAVSLARVRRVFPGPFVNYLSRFLLAYDDGSRALWRADSSEIPLSWNEGKVRRKRATQLAAFAASVEKGLGTYAEKSTTENGDLSDKPQLGVRQLLSLLRSRYGTEPDAPRQLALCFSLLEPLLQPTEVIATLSATHENASVVSIEVLDGGSLATGDVEAVGRLEQATLPAPAVFGGARRKKDVGARLAPPKLVPTGKVLGFKVVERGCGHAMPPEITVSSIGGSIQSKEVARGKIGKDGGLDSVDIDVPMEALDFSEAVNDLIVEVGAPKDNSACGTLSSVVPILEYRLEAVALSLQQPTNFGYTLAQPLDVRLPFYDKSIEILRTPVAIARTIAAPGAEFAGPPSAARRSWGPPTRSFGPARSRAVRADPAAKVSRPPASAHVEHGRPEASRLGQFAHQHASLAPDQAQGGLQPRPPASASPTSGQISSGRHRPFPHVGSGGFGGDARFLDPFLYDAACTCGGGTADFVNWKMLFDCQTLGAPCAAEKGWG